MSERSADLVREGGGGGGGGMEAAQKGDLVISEGGRGSGYAR